MKKIIAVCLVLALCAGLWFFGYYNRKSNDSIPSKELMVTSYLNKGEDYATEQIEGYKNTQLMEVWGKPDDSPSGRWGDIWETSNTYNLIVYYDSNGIVEHVKVKGEDNKEPESPNALVPSIMYNGEIYRTTGKQIPAEIDESAYAGKITSTVPLSEWPSEEGQANFGEVGTPYAVTSDGFVVLMNNEWTVFEVME